MSGHNSGSTSGGGGGGGGAHHHQHQHHHSSHHSPSHHRHRHGEVDPYNDNTPHAGSQSSSHTEEASSRTNNSDSGGSSSDVAPSSSSSSPPESTSGNAGPGTSSASATSHSSGDKSQLGVFRFVHTFNGIDQVGEGFGLLSPVYSDEFGNKWQIKLYPLGRKCEFCGNALCRKQSNHMSLYLVAAGCESLVELDWWKCVQYRMKILVPDGTVEANESTAKNNGALAAAADATGTNKTAANTAAGSATGATGGHPGFKIVGDKKVNKRKFDCNRLDWGWSEFATLTQVAENFIANNAITVAAEIELLDYDRGVKPTLGFIYKYDASVAATSAAGATTAAPNAAPTSSSSAAAVTPAATNVLTEPGCSVLSSLVQDKNENKWRLTLYPQGKGMARGRYMSLYLQASGCEELPLGWWKSVSYRIILLGRRLRCREWLRYLRLDSHAAALRKNGLEYDPESRDPTPLLQISAQHITDLSLPAPDTEAALRLLDKFRNMYARGALRGPSQRDGGGASVGGNPGTTLSSTIFAAAPCTPAGDLVGASSMPETHNSIMHADFRSVASASAVTSTTALSTSATTSSVVVPAETGSGTSTRADEANDDGESDDDVVLVRKSSNREIFNTGHQRWGWTKFIALDEAEPYLVNNCVRAHVELAVRDQDVGTLSTFTFQQTFKNLSTTASGERLLSAIHTDDANHSWQVSLYPTGNSKALGTHMSVYLIAPHCDNLPVDWWTSVKYRFTLINRRTNKTMSMTAKNEFESGSNEWGWQKFISLDDAQALFVEDDSVVLQTEVVVLEEEVGETPSFVFTHKFDMLSSAGKHARLLSQVHTDSFGNSYYTLLYPTGDGDAHGTHLSLYLAVANHDSEPLDWWKQCRYRLTLLNTRTGESRKKAGTNEFDSDCRNWGWRDFISLEEAQRLFVVDDSVTIKAEIAVQDHSSGEPSFIFLHKFSGISKAERGAKLVSPAFVDSDHEKWQVSLYPTGDAEDERGDRMAVYLTTPSTSMLRGVGWWKSVRYRISILHAASPPTGGSGSIAGVDAGAASGSTSRTKKKKRGGKKKAKKKKQQQQQQLALLKQSGEEKVQDDAARTDAQALAASGSGANGGVGTTLDIVRASQYQGHTVWKVAKCKFESTSVTETEGVHNVMSLHDPQILASLRADDSISLMTEILTLDESAGAPPFIFLHSFGLQDCRQPQTPPRSSGSENGTVPSPAAANEFPVLRSNVAVSNADGATHRWRLVFFPNGIAPSPKPAAGTETNRGDSTSGFANAGSAGTSPATATAASSNADETDPSEQPFKVYLEAVQNANEPHGIDWWKVVNFRVTATIAIDVQAPLSTQDATNDPAQATGDLKESAANPTDTEDKSASTSSANATAAGSATSTSTPTTLVVQRLYNSAKFCDQKWTHELTDFLRADGNFRIVGHAPGASGSPSGTDGPAASKHAHAGVAAATAASIMNLHPNGAGASRSPSAGEAASASPGSSAAAVDKDLGYKFFQAALKEGVLRNIVFTVEIAVVENDPGVLPTFNFRHTFRGLRTLLSPQSAPGKEPSAAAGSSRPQADDEEEPKVAEARSSKPPFVCLASDPHKDEASDSQWKLLLYPRGTGPFREDVSVHLEVANHLSLQDGWQKKVSCRVWLLRRDQKVAVLQTFDSDATKAALETRARAAAQEAAELAKSRLAESGAAADDADTAGAADKGKAANADANAPPLPAAPAVTDSHNSRIYCADGQSGIDEYGGSFGVLRGFSQEALVFTRANIRMGWRLVPQKLLFGYKDDATSETLSEKGGAIGSPFWDPEEDEVTVLVEMAVLPGSSNGADRPVRHSVSFEHTFSGVGVPLFGESGTKESAASPSEGTGARSDSSGRKVSSKQHSGSKGASEPGASDDDPPDHKVDEGIPPIAAGGVPLVPAAARAQASGRANAPDDALRPRAGRMLSSTPFKDNYNNEWTLSLLPYGLADFAPKDLTDKATVNMQFHLPLVCVVLMPVNLEFFDSWSKTARVTITLVNRRLMESKRAGGGTGKSVPPGAPPLLIRRSIQQFSSQLTKQVQWLYGIRFVHLDELEGFGFVSDGKLTVRVHVDTLAEQYGHPRLPHVMAIGPYASSTQLELQEVLRAMEGMLEALQSPLSESRESVRKHITTLLRGYGMGVPAKLGLPGVIQLLKEEMEREMAVREAKQYSHMASQMAAASAATATSRSLRDKKSRNKKKRGKKAKPSQPPLSNNNGSPLLHNNLVIPEPDVHPHIIPEHVDDIDDDMPVLPPHAASHNHHGHHQHLHHHHIHDPAVAAAAAAAAYGAFAPPPPDGDYMATAQALLARHPPPPRPGFRVCNLPGCGISEADTAKKNSESPRLSQCSRCKAAFYCSREHQRLDWADHQHDCLSVSVQQQQYMQNYLQRHMGYDHHHHHLGPQQHGHPPPRAAAAAMPDGGGLDYDSDDSDDAPPSLQHVHTQSGFGGGRGNGGAADDGGVGGKLPAAAAAAAAATGAGAAADAATAAAPPPKKKKKKKKRAVIGQCFAANCEYPSRNLVQGEDRVVIQTMSRGGNDDHPNNPTVNEKDGSSSRDASSSSSSAAGPAATGKKKKNKNNNKKKKRNVLLLHPACFAAACRFQHGVPDEPSPELADGSAADSPFNARGWLHSVATRSISPQPEEEAAGGEVVRRSPLTAEAVPKPDLCIAGIQRLEKDVIGQVKTTQVYQWVRPAVDRKKKLEREKAAAAEKAKAEKEAAEALEAKQRQEKAEREAKAKAAKEEAKLEKERVRKEKAAAERVRRRQLQLQQQQQQQQQQQLEKERADKLAAKKPAGPPKDRDAAHPPAAAPSQTQKTSANGGSEAAASRSRRALAAQDAPSERHQVSNKQRGSSSAKQTTLTPQQIREREAAMEERRKRVAQVVEAKRAATKKAAFTALKQEQKVRRAVVRKEKHLKETAFAALRDGGGALTTAAAIEKGGTDTQASSTVGVVGATTGATRQQARSGTHATATPSLRKQPKATQAQQHQQHQHQQQKKGQKQTDLIVQGTKIMPQRSSQMSASENSTGKMPNDPPPAPATRRSGRPVAAAAAAAAAASVGVGLHHRQPQQQFQPAPKFTATATMGNSNGRFNNGPSGGGSHDVGAASLSRLNPNAASHNPAGLPRPRPQSNPGLRGRQHHVRQSTQQPLPHNHQLHHQQASRHNQQFAAPASQGGLAPRAPFLAGPPQHSQHANLGQMPSQQLHHSRPMVVQHNGLPPPGFEAGRTPVVSGGGQFAATASGIGAVQQQQQQQQQQQPLPPHVAPMGLGDWSGQRPPAVGFSTWGAPPPPSGPYGHQPPPGYGTHPYMQQRDTSWGSYQHPANAHLQQGYGSQALHGMQQAQQQQQQQQQHQQQQVPLPQHQQHAQGGQSHGMAPPHPQHDPRLLVRSADRVPGAAAPKAPGGVVHGSSDADAFASVAPPASSSMASASAPIAASSASASSAFDHGGGVRSGSLFGAVGPRRSALDDTDEVGDEDPAGVDDSDSSNPFSTFTFGRGAGVIGSGTVPGSTGASAHGLGMDMDLDLGVSSLNSPSTLGGPPLSDDGATTAGSSANGVAPPIGSGILRNLFSGMFTGTADEVVVSPSLNSGDVAPIGSGARDAEHS